MASLSVTIRLLERWDRDQRTDWAEWTTNTRYGDWVKVEDTKTPMAHLKLLCHAESGNPTLTLDDDARADIKAERREVLCDLDPNAIFIDESMMA